MGTVLGVPALASGDESGGPDGVLMSRPGTNNAARQTGCAQGYSENVVEAAVYSIIPHYNGA